MEDTHEHAAPEAPLPSGAMVREHWNSWSGFTHMVKAGIVVVGLVSICAVLFITGAHIAAFIFLFMAICAALFFTIFR